VCAQWGHIEVRGTAVPVALEVAVAAAVAPVAVAVVGS
jgi:hypothetical protein